MAPQSRPLLLPALALLVVRAPSVRAVGCKHFCKNWCTPGVVQCYRLECDPSDSRDCPGSTCGLECGDANQVTFAKEESSEPRSDSGVLVPLVAGLSAFMCLGTIVLWKVRVCCKRRRCCGCLQFEAGSEETTGNDRWLSVAERLEKGERTARLPAPAAAEARPHEFDAAVSTKGSRTVLRENGRSIGGGGGSRTPSEVSSNRSYQVSPSPAPSDAGRHRDKDEGSTRTPSETSSVGSGKKQRRERLRPKRGDRSPRVDGASSPARPRSASPALGVPSPASSAPSSRASSAAG
eukprot:CAMPEP_0177353108 /NCGR_PEP_ID=MMETSP0368-20130122/32705_1 /TAXON_ID=447022 ORGANISM="Scrippsiella hangoei-like, Strain SHHI-4" /NCGR_SAMPLE_ID=MMETSP0368 /ASSEMBLY_ACC=CAM_ASM_000363 /LENGTH=292 /DNA_ID=CAMNT_0018815129 /DNA_START=24 /DNA_END=899 /DNA_ORIENTATION=+